MKMTMAQDRLELDKNSVPVRKNGFYLYQENKYMNVLIPTHLFDRFAGKCIEVPAAFHRMKYDELEHFCVRNDRRARIVYRDEARDYEQIRARQIDEALQNEAPYSEPIYHPTPPPSVASIPAMEKEPQDLKKMKSPVPTNSCFKDGSVYLTAEDFERLFSDQVAMELKFRDFSLYDELSNIQHEIRRAQWSTK